jgi:CBS domain-containing protein
MTYHQKKFDEVLVGDVSDRIVKGASKIKLDGKIVEVIDLMTANPLSRKVYVVDDDGKYVGTVNTETILRLIGYRVGVRESGGTSFYRFLRDVLKEDVKDIMVKGKTVTTETKLTAALEIMLNEHLNDLPVVDQEGKLTGELISIELFLEGRRVFEEKE